MDIEAELHQVPAPSPDINVIESIFHLLPMDLEEEAVTENIAYVLMENRFILNPSVCVGFVALKTFEMLTLNFLRYQK